MIHDPPVQVFLSHSSVDKPIVRLFHHTLKYYRGIDSWFDEVKLLWNQDLLSTLTSEVRKSQYVVLFWSNSVLNKYPNHSAIGSLSWVALEVRSALLAIEGRPDVQLIIVRLDDSVFPDELHPVLRTRLFVDGRGLLDETRSDRDQIVWRCVTEIVGTIRGLKPLYPTLELLKRDGTVVRRGAQAYLAHVSCGSNMHPGYIDYYDSDPAGLAMSGSIPAAEYVDGSLGYRFSISQHVSRGFWWAAISFAKGATGWAPIDLTKYSEMLFDARADLIGVPLSVSFADDSLGDQTECNHQETSSQVFRLGQLWKTGRPWTVDLNELDWSKNGFVNHSGVRTNTKDVERENVLQLCLNNGLYAMPEGSRWIEVKNIVLL